MIEDKFYDQGWNARIDRVRYDLSKPREWRDGWRDCHDEYEDGLNPEKTSGDTTSA
jgi:hypothetical protein